MGKNIQAVLKEAAIKAGSIEGETKVEEVIESCSRALECVQSESIRCVIILYLLGKIPIETQEAFLSKYQELWNIEKTRSSLEDIKRIIGESMKKLFKAKEVK